MQATSVLQPQITILSETQQSAEPHQKVADMSKKEKGEFFHNLRMGVNTLLAKAESGLTAAQSLAKTQTNTPQQQSILEITTTKNKGNSM